MWIFFLKGFLARFIYGHKLTFNTDGFPPGQESLLAALRPAAYLCSAIMQLSIIACIRNVLFHWTHNPIVWPVFRFHSMECSMDLLAVIIISFHTPFFHRHHYPGHQHLRITLPLDKEGFAATTKNLQMLE